MVFKNLLFVWYCYSLVCSAKAETFDELEYENAAVSSEMMSSSIHVRDLPLPELEILECGDNVRSGRFTDSTENSPFAFRSPGYPNIYPQKSKCKVTITLPKGKYMHMVFYDVDIHTSKPNKCKGDYLKIKVKGEPVKKNFCGTFNSTYQAIGPFNKSRKVVFQFMSNNDKKSGRGFVMSMFANLRFYPLGPFACGKYFETSKRAKVSNLPMLDFDKTETEMIKEHLSNISRRRQWTDPNLGKLVGGLLADPHEYPWQVLVYDSVKSSVCGGTLISSQWVLTAYHCIDQSIESPSNFLIFLNDTNIYNGGKDGSFIVGVSSVTIMDVSGFPFYDIALVKMSTALNYFIPDVYPACLPGPDYVYEAGKILTTTGWGSIINSTSRLSPYLMELELQLQSQEDCAARVSQALGGYYPAQFIICAGEPGAGICSGDSGGPLIDVVDGYSVVLGVTSFMLNGCANAPSFFANVATATGWIYSIVNEF